VNGELPAEEVGIAGALCGVSSGRDIFLFKYRRKRTMVSMTWTPWTPRIKQEVIRTSWRLLSSPWSEEMELERRDMAMLGCGESVERVLRLGGREQASGNLFIPSREIRRGVRLQAWISSNKSRVICKCMLAPSDTGWRTQTGPHVHISI
jgi:hypothetical protein